MPGAVRTAAWPSFRQGRSDATQRTRPEQQAARGAEHAQLQREAQLVEGTSSGSDVLQIRRGDFLGVHDLQIAFAVEPRLRIERCFRHQLLLPRPYLVLTKPLRLDIQCQRGASVKIGWKYLDD